MTPNDLPVIIVITGPTATGKTNLGICAAKKLNGEIISADSMQVYKDMNIGTAKPSEPDMGGVAHHMIDIVSPFDNYSVARYVNDAAACVDDILRRGKQPIIVGGSGLYVDSLIEKRAFPSQAGKNIRNELESRYDKTGGEAMLRELHRIDPAAAGKLHENDKKRIVRAFEVISTSMIIPSEHNRTEKTAPKSYNALKFALTYTQRSVLYDKINRRVDNMINAGLKEEVNALLKSGLPKNTTAMQAIGYKELVMAISGDIDFSTAVSMIKTGSTRYAKRQLTWLRKDESIFWINWDTAADIETAARIIARIRHEKK